MLVADYYRDEFLSFIKPRYLYGAALAFLVITLFIIIAIFVFLQIKRRRFFRKEKIDSLLDDWISSAIIEDDFQHAHLSPDLLVYLEKARNRQFAIDLLLNTRKNLLGTAADNIKKIYEQLDLQLDSMEKLRSPVWHIKAKGIFELYMMDQRELMDEIAAYTNV